MSTSETIEHPVGACPCGKGKVIRSITTQDNPWSSADVHIYIDCADCSREWRVEHNHLTMIGSKADYEKANRHEMMCRKNLSEFVAGLVDGYFEKFGAKTKKAEHSECVRLGISTGTYRDFLRRKNEGQSPGQISAPMKNPAWVKSLAESSKVIDRLEQLLLAVDEARHHTNVAAKKIVRVPIP
jgi:hypothetical protein